MSFEEQKRDLEARMGREIGFRPGAIHPGTVAAEPVELAHSGRRAFASAIKVLLFTQALGQALVFLAQQGFAWERRQFEKSATRLEAEVQSVQQRQRSSRRKSGSRVTTNTWYVWEVQLKYELRGKVHHERLVLPEPPQAEERHRLPILANPDYPGGSRGIAWENPVKLPYASYAAGMIAAFFGTFLAGLILLMSLLVRNPAVAAQLKKAQAEAARRQRAA